MGAFLQTKNNAKSTSTGLDNTDDPVTFSVGAGEGALFPDTADGSFRVTVWSTSYADPGDDTNMEILEVTSRSTDSFIATRAKEDTSNVAHSGTVNVALLSTSGLREELADALKTGWNPAGETWTYASASTFTVPGNVTTKYTKGTRLKWTQTTVKYGVVIASAYSSPNTTVTIAVNTDYTIANATISANYYSYAANPQGYPGWFSWTPVWSGTGGSAGTFASTNYGTQFMIVGRAVFLKGMVKITDKGSWTGQCRVSAPVPESDVSIVLTGGEFYVGSDLTSLRAKLNNLSGSTFLWWETPVTSMDWLDVVNNDYCSLNTYYRF